MAKIKRWRGLTDQQRNFVSEYCADFNAMGAAERAGYSMSNTAVGVYLLAKPQIQDEVRRRCKAMEERINVSGDDVRNFFARIVWDPRQPIDGGPTIEARMTAARELGKLMGLYTTKIAMTGTLTLEALLLAADQKAKAVPMLESQT